MIKFILTSLMFFLFGQQSATINNWERMLCEQLEIEKVSKEFYDTMYDKWDLLAFRNLSKSEGRHMECIQLLIDDLDLSSTINLKGKGQFTNKELGHLYNDLLKSGNQSVNEALKAGAYLEEKNISKIKLLMHASNNEDVRFALNELLENSKCHLGLMVCLLNNRDIDYKPVILSVNEFMDCEIIQGLSKHKESDCPFEEYDCPFKDKMN